MRVNLARDWFGPDAVFYQKAGNPHQFPQDWKGNLPTGSTVLADEEPVVEDPASKPVKK